MRAKQTELREKKRARSLDLSGIPNRFRILPFLSDLKSESAPKYSTDLKSQ